MMKATGLIGSARADGSTAYLVEEFLRGWREAGGETARYCAGQAEIRYCLGCKRCYLDGRCVQSDDVEEIVESLLASDLVVIAAPSYWGYVPGQLKTFFDRNTPYGNENPSRVLRADHPIQGIGIAVRAGTRERENEEILNAIQHYFGHLGITMARGISVTQTDTLEDLKAKHADVIQAVYKLGKTLGTGR